MKKILIVFICIVVVMSFSLTLSSRDLKESIEVYRNLVKLEVNGDPVDVDNFAFNGVTYIPLRSVSEILNKNVGWNTLTNVASINDPSYEIEALSKLLPDSTEFRWNYDGFAEYGHTMVLDNIVNEDNKREYIISGQVSDVSDGESSADYSISLKYTIVDNKLIQEKTESTMLDSKFDKLTLIETPLIAGTFWTEEVTDKDSNETTINAFIENVQVIEGGKKQYTVRYDDVNSDYYEIRTIKEGIGLVNFEKLLELPDSSFPVTYFYFNLEK